MQAESEAIHKFASRAYAHQIAPAQNIPNNAWTPLRLDTEIFDGLNELTPATALFTPRRSGYYLIIGRAYWQANLLVGTRVIDIIANGVPVGWYIWQPNALFEVHTTETSAIVYLAAGQTAQIQLYQNSGAGENLVQPAAQANFNTMYVHRLS